MADLYASLAHAWHNGGRMLIYAAAIMACSVIFLLSAVIYLQATSKSDNALVIASPQQIIDKKPNYRVGDTFVVLSTTCNRRKTPITARAASYWQSEAGGLTVPGSINNGRVIPPGCMTFQFPHTVPASVTPGLWRYAGEGCLINGHCTSWFTDQFLIVQ